MTHNNNSKWKIERIPKSSLVNIVYDDKCQECENPKNGGCIVSGLDQIPYETGVLVSAAPDLLEALELVCDIYQSAKGHSFPSILVNNAIKKATGNE